LVVRFVADVLRAVDFAGLFAFARVAGLRFIPVVAMVSPLSAGKSPAAQRESRSIRPIKGEMPMAEDQKDNRRRLTEMVNAHFEAWKSDPARFMEEHPDIRFSIGRGGNLYVSAMRCIADHLMSGRGFEYEVAELVAADPVFFLGEYDTHVGAPDASPDT
jgi:hypothetical protein